MDQGDTDFVQANDLLRRVGELRSYVRSQDLSKRDMIYKVMSRNPEASNAVIKKSLLTEFGIDTQDSEVTYIRKHYGMTRRRPGRPRKEELNG